MTIACERCGKPTEPCINGSEGMQVRAWYCRACGWSSRAKVRERLLTLDDVEGAHGTAGE